MRVRVVVVDIGSVRAPPKFAWAALDAPGREVVARGRDPESAVHAIAAGLAGGIRAALLLEAPTSVPVPADWRLLGRARADEGKRPWSAGAGCGALATGLPQGAWMLRRLAAIRPGLGVTTQPGSWRPSGAPLLIAEAFVSAAGKPEAVPVSQHDADAVAAGRAFIDGLHAGASARGGVHCEPHEPLNLLAAIASWAGLSVDTGELHQEVLVIKPN
jgi:hypothetical protein